MTLLEQILLSFITSIATAVFAYFLLWRQAKADLMKEYETRFNEKKWDAYIRLIRLFPKFEENNYNLYKNVLSPTPEAKIQFFNRDNEINDELNQIESEILLIGSDDVLYKFKKWRNHAHQFSYFDDGVMKLRTAMINAMREDLGKSKSDIDYSRLEEISSEFTK